MYSLDFEVLWPEEDAWPVLSIVYTETALPAVASEPSTRKFVLMFDLVTGDPLAVADMLTPEGVASLDSMVSRRLADVFDGPVCCFEPGELVANVGVGPDGLVVYVDVSPFPRGVGPLEFLFTWEEVADLIDMRQRFLAGFAVEAGRCSAAGENWVLEDQPGLPEPVAAKRRAIFEAAAACDFDGLGALVPLDEPDSLWGCVAREGRLGRSVAARRGLWSRCRVVPAFGPSISPTGRRRSPTAQTSSGVAWLRVARAGRGHRELVACPPIRGPNSSTCTGRRCGSFAEHGSFNRYRVLIRDDGTWWYFGVQVA